MYLLINDKKYTCSKREVSKETIKFYSINPLDSDTEELNLDNISNIIQMYRNDDFLMSEDIIENYTRKEFKNNCLTLTNLPEPTPVDPTTLPEYRISALESQNVELQSQVDELDETVIELYESVLAQEEINANYDEALISIYESIGG